MYDLDAVTMLVMHVSMCVQTQTYVELNVLIPSVTNEIELEEQCGFKAT